MKRSVNVTVAGQRFQLKTAATPAYVKQLAAFVNGRIEEVRKSGKTITTQSLALLAAMNIADDLLQLRDEHDALKRKVREASGRILAQLEQAQKR